MMGRNKAAAGPVLDDASARRWLSRASVCLVRAVDPPVVTAEDEAMTAARAELLPLIRRVGRDGVTPAAIVAEARTLLAVRGLLDDVEQRARSVTSDRNDGFGSFAGHPRLPGVGP